MGCCGEPADFNANPDEKNRPTSQIINTVNQQPLASSHLGLGNQQFQPPSIASLPPAHASTYGHNGFQQPWDQSTSPIVNQFGSFVGSGTPSTVPLLSSSPVYGSSTGTHNGSLNSQQLVRPNPIYPGSSFRTASPHNSMSSPPPMSMAAQPMSISSPLDEGKMSIAIDFGTTYSGVAYGSSRIASGKTQMILHWPGSFETFRKIPTCLLYDEQGQVLAWGLEAKNAGPMPGTTRCEWFKLFLEPHVLRHEEGAIDSRLPQLPPGKNAIDLIVDFLSCLWEYAKDQITREIGAVADLNSADVWLTVPAAWDAQGCSMMREAAIAAGLVQSSRAGDLDWRDRLRIITEPEAAAVHCAHLTDLHKLKPSQKFMICDAGGGTVDLAVYKIIGQMANLEIAEICARSGANCGSLFLDLRFRELVRTLLADHPAHLDPPSLAYFMHSFCDTDKLAYMGESDDDTMFHFTCFNVEDPDDPSVGLLNGELAIPGILLRMRVFDPVVDQVLELLEDQSRKVDQPIHALLMVGGFAGSEYLFKRVKERFSPRIKVIARPSDTDTATARGAAQYGLARRPLVSSVIAPRSYLMKVKLPAEPEDFLKRPAYIRTNDAGVPICENRLQYLVVRSSILRKGQRITTKFCKFSQSSQDSTFEAVLYTSDSDRIMRYTDEGETDELCKWTVDLSSLPTFQQAASVPQTGGFYTEFELGLELDSAEVRGLLLHEGNEWSRTVFDFFN